MNLLVASVNNQPMTSSVLLALEFQKPHKQVLSMIRSIIDQVKKTPTSLARQERNGMFQESQYTDLKLQSRPSFVIDRDGFSLLMRFFNKADLLKTKVKFLDAFNEMDMLIKSAEQKQKLVDIYYDESTPKPSIPGIRIDDFFNTTFGFPDSAMQIDY